MLRVCFFTSTQAKADVGSVDWLASSPKLELLDSYNPADTDDSRFYGGGGYLPQVRVPYWEKRGWLMADTYKTEMYANFPFGSKYALGGWEGVDLQTGWHQIFPSSSNHYYSVPGTNKMVYTGGTASPAASAGELRIYSDIDKVFGSAPQGRERPWMNAEPEFVLKSQDGNSVKVSYYSVFAMSNNGKWITARTEKGEAVINTETHAVKYFSPQLSVPYFGERAAISDDGRFVVRSSATARFVLFDLAQCDETKSEFEVKNCASGLSPELLRDKAKETIPNFEPASGLSVQSVHFSNPDTLDIAAAYRAGGSDKYGVFRLSVPLTANKNAVYLGMGDSFAAGEGAYNYRDGTDVYTNTDNYNLCHTSKNSYPYLLTEQLRFASGNSVACSGAVTGNVIDGLIKITGQAKPSENLSTTRRNEIQSRYLPGYILQDEFSNSADIATLSIGGNDVGFADIVTSCVSGDVDCYNTDADRARLADTIDTKIDALRKTYQTVKSTLKPGGRLYIVGYPSVVNPDGACTLNVQMTATERRFANALTEYLDSMIQLTAAQAGVGYVDVKDAFIVNGEDHRLCGNAKPAANGITIFNSSEVNKETAKSPAKSESFHPNALGQALLASAIDKATNRLTKSMPPVSPPRTVSSALLRSNLLDLPYSPYDGTYAIYDGALGGASGTFTKTRSFQVAVVQGALGVVQLAAGVAVSIWLHSTPQDITPSGLKVAPDGSISANISLPANIEPGYHQLHIITKAADGKAVDIYRVIFVAASETDFDGDGVPNSDEPCLFGDVSRQDVDKDGIDDACDGEIGDVPVSQIPSDPTDDSTSTNSGDETLTGATTTGNSSGQTGISGNGGTSQSGDSQDGAAQNTVSVTTVQPSINTQRILGTLERDIVSQVKTENNTRESISTLRNTGSRKEISDITNLSSTTMPLDDMFNTTRSLNETPTGAARQVEIPRMAQTTHAANLVDTTSDDIAISTARTTLIVFAGLGLIAVYVWLRR